MVITRTKQIGLLSHPEGCHHPALAREKHIPDSGPFLAEKVLPQLLPETSLSHQAKDLSIQKQKPEKKSQESDKKLFSDRSPWRIFLD